MTASATDHDVSGSTATDGLAEAKAALQRAASALHEANRELHEHEDEAWLEYASEADAAVARMEAELEMSAAKLRAERAGSTAELRAALDEAATTWRSRADEIRVQTHLGEMDARDAGLVALDRLEAAGHRLATFTDTIGHTGHEITDVVRTGARTVLEDVRAAMSGIVTVARRWDEQ